MAKEKLRTYRITLPGYQYDIEATSDKDAWKRYCELTGCKTIHKPKILPLSEETEEAPVTDGN